MAVPWREGEHPFSFHIPQKPYGQATWSQFPSHRAALGTAVVRDGDFRGFPYSDLIPAALYHSTHDGCGCNICGGSGGAPGAGSPGSQQPLPHRRRSPGRLGRAPGTGTCLPWGWQGFGGGSQAPQRAVLPGTSRGARAKLFDTASQWGAHSGKQAPAALISPARARRAGGRPGGEAGAITTLSFFRLILTSHFNLIEPCSVSRLLARRVRGLGPDAAGR